MMKDRSVFYCNYTVGPDAYAEAAQVCGLYGRRALLIGGQKAMAAALPRLTAALAGSGIEIAAAEPFGHDCTEPGWPTAPGNWVRT